MPSILRNRNLHPLLARLRNFPPILLPLRHIENCCTGGYGVDVVLECVGLEATYQQAIRMLRKRGVIGALGYLDELVAFQMRPLLFRELSVIGSTGFYWPEDHTLEMMADGRVVVEPLITHRIPLTEAQRGYELAEDPDAIKVVLVSGPDGSNE